MSGTSAYVAGRRVVHVRGTRTQTVNVCTPENRNGAYEESYRLPIGVAVTADDIAEKADLEALRTWLASRDAEPVAVGAPGGNGRASRLPARVGSSVVGTTWLVGATAAVEQALDAVVADFVQNPYLHRVESSLHAHLFHVLADDPRFEETHRLATGQTTQLLHEEWPETEPGEPGAPRGLFDLAVLAPTQVRAASLEQFRTGRIDAPVVVEAGLDHGLKHLQQDVEKLLDSRVPAPYLLHLSRVAEKDQDKIEDVVQDLPAPLRAAYAHIDPRTGAARFKWVGDRSITVR